MYVQPARTSTLAIVSLIAGIAGLSVLPLVASVVAVITGHMAKGEIPNSVILQQNSLAPTLALLF